MYPFAVLKQKAIYYLLFYLYPWVLQIPVLHPTTNLTVVTSSTVEMLDFHAFFLSQSMELFLQVVTNFSFFDLRIYPLAIIVMRLPQEVAQVNTS